MNAGEKTFSKRRILAAVLALLLAVMSIPFDARIASAEDDVTQEDLQTEEIFFSEEAYTVKYGQTLQIAAVSDAGNADSYRSSDESVAVIDDAGLLTPVSVGTVTITAVRNESNLASYSTASCQVTVEKGIQIIGFEEEEYTICAGETFEAPVAITTSEASNDESIAYSVSQDPDGIVKSIDEETGALVLTHECGTVKILASKAEDEFYSRATATYTLTVTDWVPEEETYAVSGAQLQKNSGWYTGNVSIRAKDGYLLSETKANDETTEWKTLLSDVVTTDGESQSVSFYVREEETGRISGLQTERISRDTVAPSVSITKESASSGSWWNPGNWFISNQNVTLNITASDNTSGVAKVEYYVDKNAKEKLNSAALQELADSAWKSGNLVTVAKNNSAFVYARVTDNAGNVNYANTDGIISDGTPPVAEFSFVNEPQGDYDGKTYYAGDVTLNVTVADPDPYSGIAKVTYRVLSDGTETQSGTLFEFDIEEPDYDQLVKEWSTAENDAAIQVNSKLNNGNNVVVEVTASDLSNNEATYSTDAFLISTEEPELSVVFAPEPEAAGTRDGVDYYADTRTATITVTGRTELFDESLVSISVTETDAAGKALREPTWSLSKWTTTEPTAEELSSGEKTLDDAVHTATISFLGSSNAFFTVGYTDRMGREVSEYTSETFAVDTDKPTGTVKIDASIWSKLVETLTFGLWKNEAVEISITASDATSPILETAYYITDATQPLTETELNALAEMEWEFYTEPVPVDANERLTIYARIRDYAGQTSYISSDGYITDTRSSRIEVSIPEANANGYYKSNVPVTVKVTDPEPYAGIQSIEYRIVTDGKETVRETLFTWQKPAGPASPSYEQLVSEKEVSFTIDAKENNSDDVNVYLKTVDNAGNESTVFYVNGSEEEQAVLPLKIAVSKPSVQISFDNNKPYTTVPEGKEARGYYMQRTAILQVTDRTSTFDEAALRSGLSVSGTDVNGNAIEMDSASFAVSYLGTEEGDAPDSAKHTVSVEFLADANYTFEVSYRNKADVDAAVSYAEDDVTPRAFTVDHTSPGGTVDINGNTWSRLLSVLTFGLWSNQSYTVSASSEDEISPQRIDTYVSEETSALDAAALAGLPESAWTAYKPFEIESDKQFAVYLRVTDYAGNRIFVSSDGHVLDQKESGLSVVPEAANENGVYNHDVKVQIDASETAPSSGLKSVEYWVYRDGKETQYEKLYSFEYERADGADSNGGTLTIAEHGKSAVVLEGSIPRHDDLRTSFVQTVTVEAAKNNSSNVLLRVRAEDNAGNVKEASVALDIDITAPVVQVTYDNNAPYKLDGARGYFPAARTATVRITERTNHFDAAQAKANIAITAVNAKGEDVLDDPSVLVGDWTTTEGSSPDAAVHTLTIRYPVDANYTFSMGYKSADGSWNSGVQDLAGNRSTGIATEEQSAPYQFTVDTTAPTGTVTIENFGTWDRLLEKLTFGRWSREAVTLTGSYDDLTSPVESVSYYKTTDTAAKTVAQLQKETDWRAFGGFRIPADEQFAVYLRIVDSAGNTTYLSTDGMIVDATAPVVETVAPEITLTPEQPLNDIYNTDVRVAVKVTDPLHEGTYAGLKEIRYEVRSLGTVTQEGVLYRFTEDQPLRDQLLQTWENESAIMVDRARNNSNDVEVRVFATDNADNRSEAAIALKIDITNPSISVSYNNNDGDTTFADGATGAYFRADRTATVTIYERNFRPEDVVITVTNTDGVMPAISGWSDGAGSGNGDDTPHTATITYSADGDYTFDIAYRDLAGNGNDPANYGNSLAPTAFTIDKTLPTVAVSYDNNSAMNGSFFRAARTATITITEHNFETSRVRVTLTATDNGASAALPQVSGWSSSGNVHTATISFANDARYTLDFAYADKAGNEAAPFGQQSFTVDMTNPVVRISEITDESANSGAGNIGFVITATDTNFDVFAPVLTAVIRTADGFETVTLDAGTWSDVPNGRRYTVRNLDTDGIYRITCTVVDLAGNAYSEVLLTREDGTEYAEERSGEDTLLTFTVNRNGSVFETDEATASLVKKYYVQRVTDDVVMVEINADPLLSYEVTLNGQTLREGEDYTVEHTGGSGRWERYVYTVRSDLFEAEGEYHLVVSSKDKAQNNAFSDVKEAEVSFVVDRTAPVVAISGLANGGRYRTDRQIVTLMPTDDGGVLQSLRVYLVDDAGNILETLVDLEGKALLDTLEENDGKITFAVAEGLYQNVRIVCDDGADYGDEENVLYDETITNVSVTSSGFLIFWANRPLRYGVIGAILAAIAALAAYLYYRRKKKQIQ